MLRRVESEARLRAVVEAAFDGIITIDEQGIMRSVNPAAVRMFGYAEDEMIGHNVAMLMPSPDRERHDGYIRRYLETGEKKIIGIGRVVTGRRSDGTTFPLDLSIAEVETAGQRAFVGYVRDLTNSQRSERQLQELNKALRHLGRVASMGQLSSALAHEVRQPLTAVTNYLTAASRLLAAGGDDAAGRAGALIEKARAQALRASDVIESTRKFVRQEGPVERRPVALNSAVEEACALALLGIDDVSFRLELDPDLPEIPLHRLQIQQVVVNLVRNAVEAMSGREPRELTVRTEREDYATAVIVVRDTGPGLPAEVQARLFQPFVSTKPGGTGMGLSICRTIVEAHGGTIRASTTNGGTTMRVLLPMKS